LPLLSSAARPIRMPSVSILIVGYHAYEELDRCLSSLARYEPDAEVIVVDHDADRTRGSALAAAHAHVTYLARGGNPGFGAGVNDAARHATAPLFLILNPDVELRAPIMRPLIDCLDGHDRVAIVGGRIRESDGTIQASARRFPDLSTAFGGRTSWLTKITPGNPLSRRNLSGTFASPDKALRVDWVTGAFMMTRADVFRALGGFDERFFMYWEDSDLCLRALRAGWTTMYEPAAEVMHLTGRSSQHAPVRSLVAFHFSAFRHYWKHGSLGARLLAPIVAAGLALRFLIRLAGSRRSPVPARAAAASTK
jgi:N-acetylglucosaminyl-diphospho-decaprenol L-rhamnosyltransferase